MNRQQMADTKALIELVDGIVDKVIYDEMLRVYGDTIALARFIARGDVRTVSAACGQDLAAALEALETIAAYKTWEKPGQDVFAFVTTDDEGFITADSALTIGGIHRIELIPQGGGREVWQYAGTLATRCLALISSAVVGLGLDVAADFSNGAKALTEHRDDEGAITGYSFIVRQRRA